MNRKIKSFIIVETVLYIAFLLIDYFSLELNDISLCIKFASILLCLIMSIIIYISGRDINSLLITLGIFFTSGADYFLLFTQKYAYGVILFIIVQTIYFYKLVRTKRLKHKIMFLTGIFILLNIFMLIIKSIYVLEPLTVLVSIYIAIFLTNILLACNALYKNRNLENKVFCLALVLFLMCDLNVGAVNIDFTLLLTDLNISSINYVLIWFFYVPSQVMIVLSAVKQRVLDYKY